VGENSDYPSTRTLTAFSIVRRSGVKLLGAGNVGIGGKDPAGQKKASWAGLVPGHPRGSAQTNDQKRAKRPAEPCSVKPLPTGRGDVRPWLRGWLGTSPIGAKLKGIPLFRGSCDSRLGMQANGFDSGDWEEVVARLGGEDGLGGGAARAQWGVP